MFWALVWRKIFPKASSLAAADAGCGAATRSVGLTMYLVEEIGGLDAQEQLLGGQERGLKGPEQGLGGQKQGSGGQEQGLRRQDWGSGRLLMGRTI